MREACCLWLSATNRARLAAVAADRNSPQKHVWRAGIVLLSADRVGTGEIMRRTGKAKPSVWRWQARYLEAGVDGLLRDKTRPARIPRLAGDLVERVVARTLEPPPGETTHWTVRMMARAAGISPASVQRIWAAHGLQPHRVRTFKLSKTRPSRPSCGRWSGSMSTRPPTASSSRSTRKAKSRRSTGPSRDC